MKNNSYVTRIFSKKEVDRLNKKIMLLGNSKIDISMYLSIKLVLLISVFVICLLFTKPGYLIAPVAGVLTYFLYDYLFLDLKIKKRSKLLEHDAIFFFEVLALTISSESNLKTCIEITTKAIDSSISDEFKKVLEETNLGKSFAEALNDLKYRIPSKSVNNVILNIIESNKYGNSLEESLNNEVNYLLDKRILDIKGSINKMPMKISIISVIFFIPLIFLLIVGPVIINYIMG